MLFIQVSLLGLRETADIINSHLNKPRFVDERWQEADFGGMTGDCLMKK